MLHMCGDIHTERDARGGRSRLSVCDAILLEDNEEGFDNKQSNRPVVLGSHPKQFVLLNVVGSSCYSVSRSWGS